MPRYQFNFEAIHARWPAYPAGHGEGYALETLCCFPDGTHFKILDDIDKCFLLVAVEYLDGKAKGDLFAPAHHHVALWHADLRRLRDNGWVAGFRPNPTADELRRYWMSMARDAPEDMRTRLAEHAQDFDWEAVVAEAERVDDLSEQARDPDGLTVTPEGWAGLWSEVEHPDLHEHFASHVNPLLGINYRDSAVRDASILLEAELRRRTGTSLFGLQLVDRYIRDIEAQYGRLGAFQKHLRCELRTLFKFVRNDFAHNIVSLQPGRCHAMLRRISAIYEMLDDAGEGAGSFQDIIPAEP